MKIKIINNLEEIKVLDNIITLPKKRLTKNFIKELKNKYFKEAKFENNNKYEKKIFISDENLNVIGIINYSLANKIIINS